MLVVDSTVSASALGLGVSYGRVAIVSNGPHTFVAFAESNLLRAHRSRACGVVRSEEVMVNVKGRSSNKAVARSPQSVPASQPQYARSHAHAPAVNATIIVVKDIPVPSGASTVDHRYRAPQHHLLSAS